MAKEDVPPFFFSFCHAFLSSFPDIKDQGGLDFDISWFACRVGHRSTGSIQKSASYLLQPDFPVLFLLAALFNPKISGEGFGIRGHGGSHGEGVHICPFLSSEIGWEHLGAYYGVPPRV